MQIPPTSTDISSPIHTQIKCPYCRSDLSRSICDTALLRKVDRLDEKERNSLFDAPALTHEIEAARIRQAQWFDAIQRKSSDDDTLNHSSSDAGDGDSIVATHEQPLPKDDELDASWSYTTSDTTLLGGLDSAMTFYEQEQVTRCLTSGNTEELALAAKLLYHTSEKVKRRSDSGDLNTTSTSIDLGEHSDAASSEESRLLYQLIEAGKKARYRAPPPPPPSSSTPDRTDSPSFTRPAPYQKLATQKATQFRTVEREVRRHAAYVKRHPLPTRLPKYCEYFLHFEDTMHVGQIVKSLPFRFCNDVWDGTIMDAFAKCSIHNASFSPKLPRGKNYSGHPKITSTFVDNYKVYQRRPYDDDGVRNILQSYRRANQRNSVGTAKGDDDLALSEEGRIERAEHPRVLIAAVVQPTGTVLPGDVVTHLNGTELGDTTVDDLMARIWSLCYASSSSTATDQPSRIPLQFILNADRSVAEALKWRAWSQQQQR
jgi:hypothetical protein